MPLIVGGGPAGAAAAIILARAGVAARVIERTRETGDALCGGFLSWRTLESLAALGVEGDALNRDRITCVRLFANGRVHEARLPRPAVSVSRHKLDSVLLHHASGAGAGVERGVTARLIAKNAVHTGDGTTLESAALLLASGKHDVRGAARPAAARGADPTLGLRMRVRGGNSLQKLVRGAVELHLFDRGYAGIALQEDGSANVCMAVHRSRLDDAGSPEALFALLADEAPALGERLAAGTAGAIDAVANVPYGWRATRGAEGLYRLGDQAAVIPSLAGEGMGIAIASGMSAAQAYLRDGAAGSVAWQKGFARRARAPLAIAGAVRAIAERPGIAAPLLPFVTASGLMQVIARMTRI